MKHRNSLAPIVALTALLACGIAIGWQAEHVGQPAKNHFMIISGHEFILTDNDAQENEMMDEGIVGKWKEEASRRPGIGLHLLQRTDSFCEFTKDGRVLVMLRLVDRLGQRPPSEWSDEGEYTIHNGHISSYLLDAERIPYEIRGNTLMIGTPENMILRAKRFSTGDNDEN